ncbi:glutathione S-transferase [Actinomycetaceae bacterium TAE3-ERU4]|nr:glutathione S-transferase [Actinomycetaceae bacterium TAE3-ERU4]
MDITLHHLNDSRSFRIAWALEELGAEYNLVKHQRTESLLAPAEMKEIHPLGKSPILVDGEETLVESQCILEHLSDKSGGKLSARQEKPYFWLTYCESSLMPYLVMGLVNKTAATKTPRILHPIFKKFTGAIAEQFTSPGVRGALKYLNEYLQNHEYLSDNDSFGIADIQMEFAIFGAEGSGFNLSDYPALNRWYQAVHERESYHRALARAGR